MDWCYRNGVGIKLICGPFTVLNNFLVGSKRLALKFSHFPWRLVRRSGLIQGGNHFFLVDFLNSGFSLVSLKNTFCYHVSHTLCKGAYHCGDRNDKNFFTCLWWTCLSFGQCRLRLWCDKFVWLNLDQRGDPNVCPIYWHLYKMSEIQALRQV